MFSRRLALALLTSAAVPLGVACMNHDEHDGSTPSLGTPAKGGLDQRGTALFVALGKTGEVAVVDVDGWRVAGKIKLASSFFPHHLSLSPDRTRVAVGAPGSDLSSGHAGHGSAGASGALFILDSRSGDVVAQKVVNGTAHNLAYLPDGSSVVYALSEHSMLHTANPSSLVETGSLMVGASPLEASPTGTGGLVLVSNSGAGTLSAVDVVSKQTTQTIPVGANPIAAWIGVGGKALVTSESDRKLTVVDLASLAPTVSASLSGTPGQAAHTADGKEIWVAIEDQAKLAILDGTDLKPVGEVAVGQRPHGLALSPDGSSFFVTDENTGKVHQVGIAERQIQRSLDVGGAPNGVLLRPAL